MHGDWSREIHREYSGGDVRFDLPVRPLGWGKLIGMFLVAFGLVFLWSPARDLWRALQNWLHETPGGLDLIACLFNLPFLIAGCVPLAIALLILFGRCRVQWKDGQLRSAEILGPFRWTRQMPRKPIRKLEVGAATSRTGNSPSKQFEGLAALVAEFEDGSKKLVVLGYPKEWLLAVAEELRSYVGGGALAAGKVEVTVADPTLDDPAAKDILEQPAGSLVQVEERGSNLRLVVPPAGIWRGSRGLFLFALLWCGAMAVFTSVSIVSENKNPGDVLTVFGIVLPVFWAVGIGLLLGAINMGRRSARLAAEGGRLRVETRGLFGMKQREWSRGDLAAIRADASGMEDPVIELQIHPRSGKKVGLLAGRDESELRWMATRLRRALNLPARQPGA